MENMLLKEAPATAIQTDIKLHFTFPLAMHDSSNFSIDLPTVVIVCLFYYCHPSGCEVYLIMVFICISLMTNNVSCVCPFVYLLWGNVCLGPLSILKTGLSLLLRCKRFLHISDTGTLPSM